MPYQTAAERLRKQQRALAQFGLEAFRSRDLDALLHSASQLVTDGLDVKLAKVLELLPGGEGLLIRAGVGWKPGVVGELTVGADRGSPAGYALRTGEPVISADTEKETRFAILPVLTEHGIKSTANVIIAGEKWPFGVLEADATERREFDEDDVAFLENCANLLAAAIDRQAVHAALEETAREHRMLAQELSHRVKNTLGLVQALAAQMPAQAPAAQMMRDSFLGRLRALAQAEELLFREGADALDFAELAGRALEPFAGAAGRVVIDGPALRLPQRSGRILSLVLHELATNSTKYGALSVPEGEARLSWKPEPAEGAAAIRLRWEERGGPTVMLPERNGFGTRLLTTLIGYELDGSAELNYRSSGLLYELVFPDNSA